jgi:hypothetical protein
MIISQIIWLTCLPVVIYLSYRLVVYAYRHYEKK